MNRRFRSAVAGLATAALILALASPAAAGPFSGGEERHANQVPILLDALILRPIGLVLTAAGAIFYAIPVAPIMAITRPTDIGKPFGPLVAAPARFTFADPLGEH